ncbi:Putative helicase mug81, partial [Aduncisulcus paluster]
MDYFVSQLLDMGFSLDMAVEAYSHTKNVDTAISWIIEQQQRIEAPKEKPPPKKKNPKISKGPSKARAEKKKVIDDQSSSTGLSAVPFEIDYAPTAGVLPANAIRVGYHDAECISIPPPTDTSAMKEVRRKSVSELPILCQQVLSKAGFTTLNPIQTIVHSPILDSNRNILVAAPTGAGKTGIALLSMLRVIISQLNEEFSLEDEAEEDVSSISRQSINYQEKLEPKKRSKRSPHKANIDKNFQIIYISPMKALAGELVGKFKSYLGSPPCCLSVKEVTGDTHLASKDIDTAQVIVATPEKYDIMTRRPSTESSKTRLLILDEVHLLGEERGAVLESIVMRTLRLSESTQSPIRILGLSATLPNYQEVGRFLSVSDEDMFYFPANWRPVPLRQSFVAIYDAAYKLQKESFDSHTFNIVSEEILQGRQVLVFVHSRNSTIESGRDILMRALKDASGSAKSMLEKGITKKALEQISKLSLVELRQLCERGVGFHHGGMTAWDRRQVEKLFKEGKIQVLCCTATLAWGVNLPAATVVIKGTQVYSSDKGQYVPLDILSVQQIFGRAG